MSNQPKCKIKDCQRTAIPGKSPHGLCLQHEAEIEKGILKMTCVVKGCGAQFKPLPDDVPMCPDCRKLADKIWWLLKYTEPQQEKPKLIIPGQTGGMADVLKKIARVQGKA